VAEAEAEAEAQAEAEAEALGRDIDDCAMNPCSHGTCQDESNDFTCTCETGWEGKKCDKDIDDCAMNPCGHGTCQDELNNFTCTCEPGWEGKKCDQEKLADDCSTMDMLSYYPCEKGKRVGCDEEGRCWKSCRTESIELGYQFVHDDTKKPIQCRTTKAATDHEDCATKNVVEAEAEKCQSFG